MWRIKEQVEKSGFYGIMLIHLYGDSLFHLLYFIIYKLVKFFFRSVYEALLIIIRLLN